MGLLYVYLDDLEHPVLPPPMSLADTLRLGDGRAYVRFTAGTGEDAWQTHDLLDWTFTSLYADKE